MPREVTPAYKHLFFDLDRTLWDYDANSREAFRDLLPDYLPGIEIDAGHFFERFNHHNEHLWGQYRTFSISKDYLRTERFRRTFADFGVDNESLAARMNEDYLRVAPRKTMLIDQADEVLHILKKKYRLHIITNGFTEVQQVKLREAGLAGYFEKIVTSDMAGIPKPGAYIFHYALTAVNAKKSESLMIGDDLEVDVLGARKSGIDQVYFNPHRRPHNESPTYEIYTLSELLDILG